MSFVNLKVGTRLVLGFGLVLIMLALIATIGISRLAGVNEITNRISTKDWIKAVLANDVIGLANDNARASYELFLLTEKTAIAKTLERIDRNKKNITSKLDQLEGLIYLAEGKAKLAAIREARKPYVASFTRVAHLLLEEGKGEEASRVMTEETMPALDTFMKAISELVALQGQILEKSGEEALASYQSGRDLMAALGVLAAFIGLSVAWFITRGLLKQLGGEPDYAAAVVTKIATGDLSVAIETRDGDQSSLLFAMKRMREGLTGIVTRVRGTTESITTASLEIAQGNADLSQRTEEQASSLEETASSMEELTSAVRQNTENARQANQLATSASDIAVKGGKVVSEAVHTMASISDSSKKIAEIIYVIDSIAFQTNILALNAAVEAARAGEQGRGFGVVAGEVRNLAQRSATAAKEIKTLINDSVNKVEAGSRQVNQAGATMAEIVQAVKRVTDIMAEIAAASNEQNAGIAQVNQAVTQIDDVTQQNAALVEEAAAAAEAMQEQAEMLMEAVSVFKVGVATSTKSAVAKSGFNTSDIPALAHQYG
jgi:methyl-accepting chemotaxis protein